MEGRFSLDTILSSTSESEVEKVPREKKPTPFVGKIVIDNEYGSDLDLIPNTSGKENMLNSETEKDSPISSKMIDSEYGSEIEFNHLNNTRRTKLLSSESDESEEEDEEDVMTQNITLSLSPDQSKKKIRTGQAKTSTSRNGKKRKKGKEEFGKKIVKLSFKKNIISNDSSEEDENNDIFSSKTTKIDLSNFNGKQKITPSFLQDGDSSDGSSEEEDEDYEEERKFYENDEKDREDLIEKLEGMEFDPNLIRIINENYRTSGDDQYDQAFDSLFKVFNTVRNFERDAEDKQRYDIHGRLKGKNRIRKKNIFSSVIKDTGVVDSSITSIAKGVAIPRSANEYTSLRPNPRITGTKSIGGKKGKVDVLEEESYLGSSANASSAIHRWRELIKDKGETGDLTSQAQREVRYILAEDSSYLPSTHKGVPEISNKESTRFDAAIREFGIDELFNEQKLVRTDRQWDKTVTRFRKNERQKRRRIERLRKRQERKKSKECTFIPEINYEFLQSNKRIMGMKPLYKRYRKVMKEKAGNIKKSAIRLEKHRNKENTFSPKILRKRTTDREVGFDNDDRIHVGGLEKFENWNKQRMKNIEKARNMIRANEERESKNYFKPKLLSEKRTKQLLKRRNKRLEKKRMKDKLNSDTTSVMSGNSSIITSASMMGTTFLDSLNRKSQIVNPENDVFSRNFYLEQRRRRLNLEKKKGEYLMNYGNNKKKRGNVSFGKKDVPDTMFQEQFQEDVQFRNFLKSYRRKSNVF